MLNFSACITDSHIFEISRQPYRQKRMNTRYITIFIVIGILAAAIGFYGSKLIPDSPSEPKVVSESQVSRDAVEAQVQQSDGAEIVVQDQTAKAVKRDKTYTAEEQALIDEALAGITPIDGRSISDYKASIIKHSDGTKAVQIEAPVDEAVIRMARMLAKSSVKMSKADFAELLGKNDPRLEQLETLSGSIASRGADISNFGIMPTNQIPRTETSRELADQLMQEYADGLNNLLSVNEVEQFQSTKLNEINELRLKQVEDRFNIIKLEVENLSDRQEAEFAELSQSFKERAKLDQLPLGSQVGDMSLVCCPRWVWDDELQKALSEQLLAQLNPEQLDNLKQSPYANWLGVE